MAKPHTIDVDINEYCPKFVMWVTVKTHGVRWFSVRLWLLKNIIAVANFVCPCRGEVKLYEPLPGEEEDGD